MIIGKEYKNKFEKIWFQWLKVTFSEINFGNIIANQLSRFCHYDINKKFNRNEKVEILRSLLRSLLKTKIEVPYNYDSNINEIIFFNEEDGRLDYKLQGEFVKKKLKDFNLSQISIDKSRRLKSEIDIIQTLNKLIILYKLFFFTFKTKKYYYSNGAYNNLKFYTKSLNYYDFYCKLFLLLSKKKVKVLITFCDVKEYANILTQVANNLNIVTITLQHAVYLRMSESNYSQPVINYKNMISNYIFSWGKALEKQWDSNEFDFNKIIYSGTNLPYQIKSSKNCFNENSIGILLSSEYWRHSNIEMLKITYELSVKYNYKLNILFHPTNIISSYKKELKFVNNYNCYQNISDFNVFMAKNIFLVCHTTSLYLTALINGKKCFRYKDPNFIDIGGLYDDIFINLEEFEKILLTNELVTYEYLKRIKKVLEFHYGSSSYSYAKALKEVMHKEKIVY
jgi:hypothetical protein